MFWLEMGKESYEGEFKKKKKAFFCLLYVFEEGSRVLGYWLLSLEFDTDGQNLL